MTNTLILDPLVPLIAVYALALLTTLGVGFAAWRRLGGWWLRGLAALAVLGALTNPSFLREDRAPLSDIVIALVDKTASQKLSDRTNQTADALDRLQARITRLENTELRVVTVPDGDGDAGTQLMTALAAALAEEPQARVAGIVALTDGRLHDIERAPNLPAPIHTLLSGRDTDWDRRLTVSNAPAFAILGETVTLSLRIDDQGAAPVTNAVAALSIAIDGAAPVSFQVPVGQDIELPLDLPHGGMNVVQFATPMADGELTDQNNAAVVQINGVRDRLRVLLVSGEPHPGERTWRNLLKSDAGVDLVHFTILRPPEKQDGVPVDELSLIAFPTRELFLEKINDFDLIIFDRYRRRGILPAAYFDSITDYVINGGAVLISSGPEYGGAESIYRSPLEKILPGAPTARVFEEGFTPQITDLGARHPVTEGLEKFSSNPDGEGPGWGRWFRLVDVIVPDTANIVMSGLDNRPLLTLDRIGEGRVALIASDQSWLWDRGFEGGGPQLELLRRLAHWMMKEPDLEEEALFAQANGQTMRIIRRTLTDTTGDVTITHPDGTQTILDLNEVSPGRFETMWTAPDLGLYRLTEADKETVIALGPAAPREFEQTIASGDVLRPIVDSTRGGTLAMADGDFAVRSIRAGRPAAGRGWIGITPRGAYQTADISSNPVLPAWAFLILAALLSIAAWLREGRKMG
ncbi:MAG: hypothetical protein KC448_05885 [Yoonia sp.]|nr:hypothetical protein [Yoonia sp.]